MVLSADPEQDPNSLAVVGAGAALAISDIPFHHVLGGVRVGMVKGEYIANPTYSEGRESKLNIIVAGTEERHRDGGGGRAAGLRAGGRWGPSNSAISAARRSPRPFDSWWRRPASRSGHSTRTPLDQALYDQIATQAREELTDALNTEKYPKAGKLRPGRRS